MPKVSMREKFVSLEPIVFVNSTSVLGSVNNKKNPSKETFLDGDEVCRFYEEVVSSPPTINNNIVTSKFTERSESKNSRYHDFVKKQKIPLVRPTSNTMFRYAETGDLKGMKQCLDSGLDVNATDMYEWTCLMCAACSGSRDMIKYLLKNGAHKDLRNSAGKTAVDLASHFGHLDIVEIMNEGSVNVSESRVISYGKASYFCKLCKMEFSEDKDKHETSISHQLNILRPRKRTHYHIPETNIGFQMMIKEGWDKDKGLGPDGLGKKFPIKTIMKQDRLCLGNKSEKPRITHFQPFDVSAIKNVKQSVAITVRKRTLNKWQRAKKVIKDKQKEINFRRDFY